MLEEMKQRVYEANQLLVTAGLITLTWGNASEIDRGQGLVAIKPSGVDYAAMRPEQMVVTDLNGTVIEGKLRPSSDLPTHLALYRAFPGIGGVVHTHSTWATSFAQAEEGIPCYGTTHADAFYGEVPCTRQLSDTEIQEAYEQHTGDVIVETFQTLDPMAIPGVLVARHGPFTWGGNAKKAVENAIVLEEVAHMAFISRGLRPDIGPVQQAIMDKHYFRKHGPDAYYGQR